MLISDPVYSTPYLINNCSECSQIADIMQETFAIIVPVLQQSKQDKLVLGSITLSMQLSLLTLSCVDTSSPQLLLVTIITLKSSISHSAYSKHIFSSTVSNHPIQHSLLSFIFTLKMDNHKNTHFRPFLLIIH